VLEIPNERKATIRYMKVGRRASIKLFGERKKKKSAHAHFKEICL
jgi:hypothetical protein